MVVFPAIVILVFQDVYQALLDWCPILDGELNITFGLKR